MTIKRKNMKEAKKAKNDSLKILVICGLTASGKTSLALKVAKKLKNTTIISVDSRQSYQALPVLTGQDIPPGFTRHQDKETKYKGTPAVYFKKDSIRIWGVDQVSTTELLEVSSFTNFIWEIIKKESSKNQKIIIVGGSGLYLKAITKPLLDIHSGFNHQLRQKLSTQSVALLQKNLKKINPSRFKDMNRSDRLNPRRLIRAIEISKNPSQKPVPYLADQKKAVFHWVGLKPDLKTLEEKIKKRVITRLSKGVLDEVKTLVSRKSSLPPSLSSVLGLSPLLKYLDQKISKVDLIGLWVKADLKFAKRQLTWFSKESSIIWYDQINSQSKLVNNLSSWLADKKHDQIK
jgi:tRNA dimethylallyltransferase